jgi:hypothetical protein
VKLIDIKKDNKFFPYSLVVVVVGSGILDPRSGMGKNQDTG